MSVEPAFKALDYDLKLYGFWPLDLFGLFVLFGLIHGVFDRPIHIMVRISQDARSYPHIAHVNELVPIQIPNLTPLSSAIISRP